MEMKPEAFTLIAEDIKTAHPDKDPQTLYLHYKSLFPPNPYLKDEVKIEFSVRSLTEPYEERPIQSLLWEYFPNKAYEETPSMIRTTQPRKTFLEKTFLLHEKFAGIVGQKIPEKNLGSERGSRHLYDIVKMDEQGITNQILNDPAFYNTLQNHRRHWIRLKGFDYTTLHPSTINFVPPNHAIAKYQQDYIAMTNGGMLTTPYHHFNIIHKKLQTINDRFRTLVLPTRINL